MSEALTTRNASPIEPRSKSNVWVNVGLGAGIISILGLIWYVARPPIPKKGKMATPEHVKAFAAVVNAAIMRVKPDLALAARLLLIAQAAFETGWGRTTGYLKGNNLFNITADPNDKRPIVMGPDEEYDKAGNVKKITQRFLAYPTLEASVDDFLAFINRARYQPALNQLLSGDIAYLDTLYRGGYFTLPVAQYKAQQQKIVNMLAPVVSA